MTTELRFDFWKGKYFYLTTPFSPAVGPSQPLAVPGAVVANALMLTTQRKAEVVNSCCLVHLNNVITLYLIKHGYWVWADRSSYSAQGAAFVDRSTLESLVLKPRWGRLSLVLFVVFVYLVSDFWTASVRSKEPFVVFRVILMLGQARRGGFIMKKKKNKTNEDI